MSRKIDRKIDHRNISKIFLTGLPRELRRGEFLHLEFVCLSLGAIWLRVDEVLIYAKTNIR